MQSGSRISEPRVGKPPSPSPPPWPSTRKAKALKAAGEPVIGFGAGEPDFPTPAHIVEAAVAACQQPGDAPLHAGRRPARPEGGHRRRRRSATRASTLPASQVLVTNGGKHAVYTAFQTLLDPGDEVLLPAPYWTTYPEAIALTGGVHRRAS